MKPRTSAKMPLAIVDGAWIAPAAAAAAGRASEMSGGRHSAAPAGAPAAAAAAPEPAAPPALDAAPPLIAPPMSICASPPSMDDWLAISFACRSASTRMCGCRDVGVGAVASAMVVAAGMAGMAYVHQQLGMAGGCYEPMGS